jgi:hypothetical protein
LEVRRESNKITISVELFKKPYLSSTKKSMILFSSKGFQWFEDIAVNLTIITKKGVGKIER